METAQNLTNAKAYVFKWQTLLPLLLFMSCDSFKEDQLIEGGIQTVNDYYTVPTLAVVIDLRGLISTTFETTTVSIAQRPLKGQISQLDFKTFTYRPFDSFTEGVDQFIVTQVAAGREIAKHIVKVHVVSPENLPCTTIAVEDRREIEKGKQVIIPVMDNDKFCNEPSNYTVSIDLQPQKGTATLVDNTIVYMAGPDFSAYDRLTYRLASTSGETLGLVTLVLPGASAPDELPIDAVPIDNNDQNLYAIEFLTEMTGFKAGPGIFKTTDGGQSWRQVLREVAGANRSFVDVQFINDMEGFAIYTGKACYDGGCANGLAYTQDGGETWTGLPMKNQIHLTDMHFFTRTSGVIAGSTDEWWGDNQIFNTTDGGKTWNSVLLQDQDWFYWMDMKLGFADGQSGYAVQQDIIFETNDSGHTWTNRIDYGGAAFMGYTTFNRDTLIASTRIDTGSELHRYVNEQRERRVATLPGYITRLAFSPSKRTGLGIGVEYSEGVEGHLMFYRSQDRGNTWKVTQRSWVPVDVYCGIDIAAPTDHVAYMLYNNVIYKQTF
ncbi:hypothetical protein WBG78_28630 [Chryseolinea sp. T2]|uniref:hypothetical protein n=1 Tax=Chryseolinea sp. T2 TaxID=3129255 RepID=UPI003077843C